MGPNILSVPAAKEKILEAWQHALLAQFRQSLTDMENPYHNGNAVEQILDRLKTVTLDAKLTNKQFQDIKGTIS